MASVAEVKAAVAAALQHVSEGQAAIRAARDRVGEAQTTLTAALDGSAAEAVGTARASLAQADQQLGDCLSATLLAVEQAQTYAAAL
ncbi:hypothetical protein [Spirilliplanes yamanashiensis]|uniref:Uncharacterized protein n=1 Tax=Spirilliplanes yamanashiensis TaxID=42233 RepID=A0A8J3YAN0_9ACTN|nr:hypothetical protein [Spirilliplanes yamanashiensis]MDP9817784.1 hypothetical protein [Spirilliplanes yamanashiensis]GIJ04594.1 hypothetical protein Sya03_39460 [Spirilliplanes yamanashiensis]